MEESIQKLDFTSDGVSTTFQINDLKSTPLPTKADFRSSTRKVAELLEDNYPELVAKNVFVNVPFWYFAFSTLLTTFLSHRTKNKFVSARASRVTEVLLKYVSGEQIPVEYGGLKRKSDFEFSTADCAQEAIVKAGSTETIEIPAPEREIRITTLEEGAIRNSFKNKEPGKLVIYIGNGAFTKKKLIPYRYKIKNVSAS